MDSQKASEGKEEKVRGNKGTDQRGKQRDRQSARERMAKGTLVERQLNEPRKRDRQGAENAKAGDETAPWTARVSLRSNGGTAAGERGEHPWRPRPKRGPAEEQRGGGTGPVDKSHHRRRPGRCNERLKATS